MLGEDLNDQISHMGCCILKPPTLVVQDNSINVAYPEAVRVRVPNRVCLLLLILYKIVLLSVCFQDFGTIKL